MTKSLKIIFIMLLLFVWKGEGVWGQSVDPETGKTILGPDIQRTALVGPDCMVNTMIDVVNVIGGNAGLDSILDNDLNNYVELKSVADVTLLHKPVIRVKDTKNIYKQGTKAGFCIQSGNTNLLELDLLKAMQLGFYKDDELVEEKTVAVGDEGLLSLGLISLPGSSESVLFLETEAPCDFDEIAIMASGVKVGVFSNMKIRYAYVGNEKTTYLINDGNIEGFNYSIDGVWDEDNIVNGTKTDYATQKNYLGLAILPVDVTMEWTTEFKAGAEFGFHLGQYVFVDLNLSGKDYIELWGNNGNYKKIELSRSVLDIRVLSFVERDISVVSDFDVNKVKLHISGGVLDIGSTNIYYGYVNEKPITPTTCKIDGLGMDATICDNETTYQLSPTEGVKWALEKVTVGSDIDSEEIDGNYITSVQIDSNGKVTGMAFEGYYHFKATKGECSDYLVVKRGVTVSSGCNVPVTEKDGYVLQAKQGTEFGISLFEKITDRQNILDEDPDNYAECTPSIALLNNTHFIGVRKTNGSISDGENKKKVGFLVETSSDFLSLSVLEFFYIKLYKDGSPLDGTYTVQDWNVVSAGLIGSEKASKSRLGVTIPANVDFDGFALWTGGVADVDLSTIRIYSAYVEDMGEGYIDCDDPLGCDAMIVGDGALDKAYINYDGTYLPAISVGAGMTGLENLLSGELNPDKYLRFASIATVASPMSIAVNFGRVLGPSHQSGFVVDRQTFLANVRLIGVTQIRTYLNGNEQEVKSDWSVLGADVIGFGDYAYLTFNPTKEYDEIRLVFASGLEALGNLKIYAVFVRNDADGDGIPDCMDPDSCTGDLTGLAVTKDVCVGDNILLSAIANFKNVDSKEYTLTVSDGTSNVYTEKITIKNGLFEHYFKLDKAGQYTLTLTEVLGEGDTSSPNAYTLTFTVHPLETTWKNNNTSTDWNTWENWSEGSPWTCTDVIIPTGAQVYPLLESGVLNGCHYIHFEPNTEVVNTHYLTYTKAWVEMALKPNRYYMVSMPLKGVYSGDLFLPRYKEGESDNGRYPDYFKPLNEESLPANRVYPTVYQRIWNNTAVDKLLSGSSKPIGIATSQWTSPFNWLSTPYEKNGDYDFNALSIWVHPLDQATDEVGYEGDYDYIFRFPKEHTTYYYYDEKGKETNIWAQIKRDAKSIGRFIYENEEGKTEFPVKMVYKNEEASHYFLIGNPFMAHLDVAKLFEDNPHLKSIKIYDGTGANTVINPTESDLLVTNRGEEKQITAIAPMQSFLVEVENENATTCEVTFTEAVLTAETKEGAGWLKSDDRASAPENVIRLNALVENMEAGASLYFSPKANDNYRRGEDSELLMDGDVKPDVAVFTTLDGQALDIQQRVNGGEIPVGIYLSRPQEVTFSVVIPKGYDGWTLVDGLENRVYPLLAGQRNEIPLGRMTTNVGRFYLRGASATSNQVITATQPKVACYSEEGSGRLIVRSLGDVMTRCEVYSVGGNMSGMSMMETYEYSLPVSPGVAVVKVYFRDGISSVFKVFVNK